MKYKFFYLVILIITGIIVACESEKNEEQQAVQTDEVTYNFPSYCDSFPVPEGFEDKTFALSQDYPQSFDEANFEQPWKAVDFTKDYKAYMAAILDYSMEGNLEVDFKGQDNAVRKWYNAPWLHDDGHTIGGKSPNSGRECLHGLTREITIKPYTLSPNQEKTYQTWAIAYYNEPGGHTMGQVWKDAQNPDLSKADFPEGTVCFKLLLTEADLDEAPYLEGSLEWTANIFTYDNTVKKYPPLSAERTNQTVRLVQLDISVKDERAPTGWVYGTFTHDASKGGDNWVNRLVPVGLMWGDDSDNTSMLNVVDEYNPSLKQSVINQELLSPDGKEGNQAFVMHLGMGGRMNGPVDNPISSCMSCHGRAATTPDGHLANIANFGHGVDTKTGKARYTAEDFEEYFSEVKCGIHTISQPNGKDGAMVDYQTLDFSFQLANGYNHFRHFNPLKEKYALESLHRNGERKERE